MISKTAYEFVRIDDGRWTLSELSRLCCDRFSLCFDYTEEVKLVNKGGAKLESLLFVDKVRVVVSVVIL